jgi:hypothetical protein
MENYLGMTARMFQARFTEKRAWRQAVARGGDSGGYSSTGMSK